MNNTIEITTHDEGRLYIDSQGIECEVTEVDLAYDKVTINFYDAEVQSFVRTTMDTETFKLEFDHWSEFQNKQD